MRKYLAAAITATIAFVLPLTPSGGAPHHEIRTGPTRGERPQRETVLLKSVPIKRELKDRNRDAWIQRVLQRRQERRAAARAARAAARSAPTAASASPAPQASYAGGPLSAEQVADLARAAGFPESVVPTMVAIAARESGFDPSAVNPTSGACGLYQLFECPGPQALDPAVNTALAYAKYRASGLSPWSM